MYAVSVYSRLNGGMAVPASTRISARLKRVQGHVSPVTVAAMWLPCAGRRGGERRDEPSRAAAPPRGPGMTLSASHPALVTSLPSPRATWVAQLCAADVVLHQPAADVAVRLATTLRIQLQAESYLLSLKRLDPGSGRKIPAIWHGAGAYPSVFIPET